MKNQTKKPDISGRASNPAGRIQQTWMKKSCPLSSRLLFLLFLSMAFAGRATAQGIPEPSLILYGTIRNTAVFNSRVTSGTLSWTFNRLQGAPRSLTLTTALSNVLGQFSYVLEVPCETLVSGSVSSNVLELLPTALNFERSQVALDGVPIIFNTPSQTNAILSSQSRGSIARLDFTVNIPCEDLDTLGLCDDWEHQYFGNIGHLPDFDEDNDGLTNQEEFIAGTDPNDPSSFFQFISSEPYASGGVEGFKVDWRSADGRSYSLLRSSTLLPGNFSVIASNLVGLPPVNSFIDTNAVPPGPYFYNLFIQP